MGITESSLQQQCWVSGQTQRSSCSQGVPAVVLSLCATVLLLLPAVITEISLVTGVVSAVLPSTWVQSSCSVLFCCPIPGCAGASPCFLRDPALLLWKSERGEQIDLKLFGNRCDGLALLEM